MKTNIIPFKIKQMMEKNKQTMKTKYRAELFLDSRLRETERKRLEVVHGRLKGIVDSEIQDRVLESYNEEIKMYKYLLDLL